MRHFGGIPQGVSVWKDQGGTWHHADVVYAGGGRYIAFVDGVVVSDTTDEGIFTAQEHYLGGHEYEVSESKATELRAAGFFVGGHFTTEEDRWSAFAVASANNLEWKGGDACASLARPDGTSLWTYADNIIGIINGAGFYTSGLPTRNALLQRSALGVLTQPKPEGSHPAWTNPTPGHWWWPMDLTNDGLGLDGPVYVIALDMTTGATFGVITQNQILTLSAFATIADTDNLSAGDDFFVATSHYKDDAAGFHYVIGHEFLRSDPEILFTDRVFNHLARVPIGSFATPAAWQYWDGNTWTSTQSRAVRLQDDKGSDIEGSGATLTKVGSDYILAETHIRIPGARLYHSTSVTGPYTFYHQANTPQDPVAGQIPPQNLAYAYYQPKFHEHLNPNANTLVLSYNRNTLPWSDSGLTPAPITTIHHSTFMPQFIYVPTP